jgi:hypothetical protein
MTMKPFRVNNAVVTFKTQAEVDAHNLPIARNAVKSCETLDDVGDMAIELAGHLSTDQFNRFEGLLMDEWYRWQVNRLCAEVGAAVVGED